MTQTGWSGGWGGGCTKYRVSEKALYWVTGASGVAFCSEGMAR